MPVYEYECEDCGNKTEVFYPAIPRIVQGTFVGYCSQCRSSVNFTKTISAANFALKGDGWAKDGYTKR